LRKDYVDWWAVRDINAGNLLPENEAKNILKKLINNGFAVEVWANGIVEGVKSFWITASVHVTRIS
jgi:hypothetical protein